MPGWVLRVASFFILSCGLALHSAAQGSPPLRLKARTFVPPANVHAGAALARSQVARPQAGAVRGSASRRHVLIQFAGPITAGNLADLKAAGAVALRYVPDHALAISAGPGFDASTVPGARWLGGLEPGDRVSADTAADLALRVPRYALTVIQFHADVDRAAADARLAVARATRIATPRLPAYMALVRTEGAAIEALSTDEAVAWIFPGAPNLAADSVLACEGTVTGDGIVADFATVGEGWDGDGLSGVDLSYVLQEPSIDVRPDLQQAELGRALGEWSKYVDVRWHVASRVGQERSVTTLWGPTDHGDGYPFAPEVLAHTFYPSPSAPESIAGDMHFNENYLWGVGDATRYDIFSVALHEAGHALGLAHSSNPDAVMYSMYRGIVTGLSSADIRAARSLYGTAPEPTLPPAWTNTSIGAAMAGEAADANGRFTLDATGADIWGTFDEFRFVSTTLTGDGDIVARVDSLQAVHRWTKAGVMIRATAAAGSPHAFMLVSGAKGLAFQRRRTPDGLTVSTDGVPGAAPYWLWLSRRGTTVSAHASADGRAWALIGADTIALGTTALAGLAVTSHDSSSVATALFSNVSVTRAREWTSADIGSVGRKGVWTPSPTGGTVLGAGEDIWGAGDAFHFVSTPMYGDGEIVARVASLEHVRAWTKAGVMIRASRSDRAAHAFMLVSAGKGYAFQRRPLDGGWSEHTAGGGGTAPGWVRLVRRGDAFTAYRSADGVNWTYVGSDTIVMPADVLVGLAVSSHAAAATARAVFGGVAIR